MSFGVFISNLMMAVGAVVGYSVIIMSFILLVYLLRIARWYIKKNEIPPLFGRKNKKDIEE